MSKHPTQDEVRQARHMGFRNSLAHLPAEKMTRLAQAYLPQDKRREKNVSTFFGKLRAAR